MILITHAYNNSDTEYHNHINNEIHSTVGTIRLHTYQLDSSDNYIPNNVENSETTYYNNQHTTNDSIIYIHIYM
jgi:hypothetical protein